QVLGAVRDLDVALGVDGGHIPGAEPAVFRELRGAGGIVVVAAGGPPPAHLDLAHALAVPRLHRAHLVHHAHVPAGHHRPLLGADVVALLVRQAIGVGARAAHGAEG